MANKYYILLEGRKVYGPYNFKVAIDEQRSWRIADYSATVLKEVVDREGREIK